MKKIYSINAWRTISTKGDGVGDDEEEIPALVYVAREKRRAWPHHFKAGALNALVRACLRLFLPLISLACGNTSIHAWLDDPAIYTFILYITIDHGIMQ